VSRLVDVLGSDGVALDGRHTPALYSRFLSSLLSKYNVLPPRDPDSPPTREAKFYPQYGTDRADTPPHGYFWPDIAYGNNVSPLPSEGSDDFLIYQRAEDPDMDLSLTHFIRTVNGEPFNGDDYRRIPDVYPTWEMQASYV
jgi:transcriptional regulatory protein LEU3